MKRISIAFVVGASLGAAGCLAESYTDSAASSGYRVSPKEIQKGIQITYISPEEDAADEAKRNELLGRNTKPTPEQPSLLSRAGEFLGIKPATSSEPKQKGGTLLATVGGLTRGAVLPENVILVVFDKDGNALSRKPGIGSSVESRDSGFSGLTSYSCNMAFEVPEFTDQLRIRLVRLVGNEAADFTIERIKPEPISPPPTPTPKNVEEAKQFAIKKYPALGVADSSLNAKFLSLHKRYQTSNPAFFKDPSWPLKLADEAAKTIQIKRAD